MRSAAFDTSALAPHCGVAAMPDAAPQYAPPGRQQTAYPGRSSSIAVRHDPKQALAVER